MNKPPLILTLSMEQEAVLFFNALRKKHFPPERNYIDAHLTLFHALQNESKTVDAIREVSQEQMPFILTIKEVVSIGKGTAFKIESSELTQLHKMLQNGWHSILSPQDRQKLWPHITVQNKVQVQEAQQLMHELKNTFTPFSTLATGLQLWEYLNGPWKFVDYFPFKET